MPDMYIPYETPYCDEEDGCAGGGGSNTVPPGGTTGQVLTKLSNADFDDGWSTPSGGGGGGSEFIVASSLYSPPDWVAKAAYLCDGTADDVEINQAIADAATLGGGGLGGGIVLLAPGIYFGAADITVLNMVSLEGFGSGRGVILGMQGCQVLADFGVNNFVALRNLSVLAFLDGPVSGALVDFGTGSISAQVENLFLGTAGVDLDASIPQYFADIRAGDNGYIRNVFLPDNGWLPAVAYLDQPAMRLSASNGADITSIHAEDNTGVSSFLLDMGVGEGSIAQGIYTNGGTVRVSVNGGVLKGLFNNSAAADGVILSTSNYGDISGIVVQFASNGQPNLYNGIHVLGAAESLIHDNSVRNCADAQYGFFIESGDNNYVHHNNLQAGAVTANYFDTAAGTVIDGNLT